MHVGVIGINHKLANLKLREQLAKTCQKRFGAAHSVHNEHHFVLLSTCNRTEVYFSSEDLTQTHSYLLNILRQDVKEEFDHKLYSYFGVDCLSHLSCVTTGLDSAVIAETEIQGQVKLAYESALEYNTLPKELHFLFQKALGIAKKIRSELQLSRGMPTIEHAVFNTGKQFFGHANTNRILFVVASQINQKILSYFISKNLPYITICNRSSDAAKKITDKYPIQTLEWNRLSSWHYYDWIIFGTKSPEYLIGVDEQELVHPKLIMDLCVPRNVDPALGFNPNITLMNIDQLNHALETRCHHANESLVQAESMIFKAAGQIVTRYLQKDTAKITPLAVIA